ncbi:RING-H2 finger protein [Acrasis kona]|uniref:RING-H2 finger protein n=1 Tax=Acrasis kona TaxID=1008807 RepID=A0AAW2Z8I6_9EUKA
MLDYGYDCSEEDHYFDTAEFLENTYTKHKIKKRRDKHTRMHVKSHAMKKMEKNASNVSNNAERAKQNIFNYFSSIGAYDHYKNRIDRLLNLHYFDDEIGEMLSSGNEFLIEEAKAIKAALMNPSEIAPCGLSYGMLQELQSRELTPEDYALLTELDKTIAPRTLSNTHFSSLPTREVTEECEESCAICLMEYEIGDTVTQIPKCGHYFHKECIEGWLSNCSTKCPVDNLPIDQ